MIMFGCAMSILRAQHVRAVGELAGLHAAQQIEILLDGSDRDTGCACPAS